MTPPWRLNLLSLGDPDALSPGINVTVLRWAVIILVSPIAAAQVVAGADEPEAITAKMELGAILILKMTVRASRLLDKP